MKIEEPIYIIYLCENCKQVTTDKTSETLRHRLNCKLHGEDYGILKFEHAYQLVDYYENVVGNLKREVSHHRCLRNQADRKLKETLTKLQETLGEVMEEIESEI